jgi:desulfoferrodoxin (superoxide reductase-like protein)
MVIDRSKIRRERVKVRRRLQVQSVKHVSGLYFDGRKDKTRVQVKKGKKSYPHILTEEHITLVSEPTSQYLGHITPASGTAKNIQSAIVSFLLANEIDTDKLTVIGCDGTNVNTGTLGGIIRLVEMQLHRPFHWFICMLHGNELPLRHLFQRLDGGTQGPNLFSGDIGKALGNCELQPSVLLRICGQMTRPTTRTSPSQFNTAEMAT